MKVLLIDNRDGRRIGTASLPCCPQAKQMILFDGRVYDVEGVLLLADDEARSSRQIKHPVQVIVTEGPTIEDSGIPVDLSRGER